MRFFHHDSELWLPRPRDDIFAFFANAENLETLTPPWLRFRIVSPKPIEMRTGTLIDYQLRVGGFPFRWRSEIAAWDPPRRFVDTQLRGPYRVWRHEHLFEEREGGTVVIDHVEYAVPGGWLIDRLFVRRDVKRIFKFRRRKLCERFFAKIN